MTFRAITNNVIVRAWQNWTKTRSPNREEAFRESTIRVTIGVVLIVLCLALLSNILIFRDAWSLISYQTIMIVAIVTLSCSGIAIAQGNITGSAWWLLITMLVGSIGVVLVSGYMYFLGLPAFSLTVLMSALLLPRRSTIFRIALLCALCETGVAAVQMAGSPHIENLQPLPGLTRPDSVPVGQIGTLSCLVLLAEAAFLWQLRREFDNRQAALRTSIHEAEMARQEADQANRTKSQFLANMSHELRTPLNAVIGYAEIMIGGMGGVFTDKQLQLIDHIHQNAKRLLDLINGILDLARVEAGRVEIIATPNLPRKLIGGLVENMQSIAQKKKLILRATFAENMPEVVVCDAGKVQQVATNLIGNALKFTKEGEVEVVVGSAEEKTWYIKVRDTGTGMPKDKVDTIFEMFSQLDNADTREHEGTGLGLAITKRLIERMGGTISVNTEMGIGSTFTVTLPRLLMPSEKNTGTKPAGERETPKVSTPPEKLDSRVLPTAEKPPEVATASKK